MRILIKEILEDKDYYHNLPLTMKEVFNCKFDYVIDRLYILDEEMTIEENNNENALVLLSMEAEIDGFVMIKGYSPKLLGRISGSFSSDDGSLLESKIYQIRNTKLN